MRNDYHEQRKTSSEYHGRGYKESGYDDSKKSYNERNKTILVIITIPKHLTIQGMNIKIKVT